MSKMLHQPLRSTEDWLQLSGGDLGKRKRLIERNSPFFQSSSKVNVRCSELENDHRTRWARLSLQFYDWFDFFLSFRTSIVIVLAVIAYTVQLIIWAGLYMSISCEQSNPPLTFHEAFAFSLETSTTIGFTLVRDQNVMFFGGCANWIVAIYFQSMFSLLMNGLILGIVTMRVQRGSRRSRQIVFSNKACIICLRGKFYLTFQVFDMSAAIPAIQTTVKMFAVFREPSAYSPAFFQTRAMRTVRPDDELGAKLWLTVPAVVIHEIDAWSPLAPLSITRPPKVPESVAPNRFPNPIQRTAEGRTGSRAQSTCSVCGNSFSTEGALRRHIEYMAEDEKERGLGEDELHRATNPRDISRPVISRVEHSTNENFETITPEFVREELRERLSARQIEIVVVVEGLDPYTSNAMQARHSYTISDIEFDKQHAPCMVTASSGEARINLSKFHELYSQPMCNIEIPIPFASHT